MSAIFMSCHFAAGVLLLGCVIWIYVKVQHDYYKSRATITMVEAQATEIGCRHDGWQTSGFVFLACDVTQLPRLTEAPAFETTRSLLSRRYMKGLLAMKLKVDIWRPTLKSCGKNCQKCYVDWNSFASAQCKSIDHGNIDEIYSGLRMPEAFQTSFVVAAGANISIGGSETGDEAFHLAGALRNQLVVRAWNDGNYFEEVPLQRAAAQAKYQRDGILETRHLTTDPSSGLIATTWSGGPGFGDLQGSFEALRVEGVSVFAQQTTSVSPEDAVVELLFGTDARVPGMEVSATAWPQHNGQNFGGAWLAPADGIGYIFPQKMTKSEAVAKLRAENSGMLNWGLFATTGISLFSAVWSCCGIGFVGAMGGGGSVVDNVCSVGWGLLMLVSLLMVLLSVVSFFLSPTIVLIILGIFSMGVCCSLLFVFFKKRSKQSSSTMVYEGESSD